MLLLGQSCVGHGVEAYQKYCSPFVSVTGVQMELTHAHAPQ